MKSFVVVFAVLAISYPLLDALRIPSNIKSSNKDVDNIFESFFENDDSLLESFVDKKEGEGCPFGCIMSHHFCICPHPHQVKDSDDQSLVNDDDLSNIECRAGCVNVLFTCVCINQTHVEDSIVQSFINKDEDSSMESSVDKKKEKKCHFGCLKVHHFCVCPHHVEDSDAQNSISDDENNANTCHNGCIVSHDFCICPHHDDIKGSDDQSMENSVDKKQKKCHYGCLRVHDFCVCPHPHPHHDEDLNAQNSIESYVKNSVDYQTNCKEGCIQLGPVCFCIKNTKVSKAKSSHHALTLKSISINIFAASDNCSFGCIKNNGVCICPKSE